jgi:sodium/bile acid cotransporter 7
MTGNLLGVFITPLLLDMFLTGPWEYGAPIADGGQTGADGLRLIYRQLAKQLGLSIFVPIVSDLLTSADLSLSVKLCRSKHQ